MRRAALKRTEVRSGQRQVPAEQRVSPDVERGHNVRACAHASGEKTLRLARPLTRSIRHPRAAVVRNAEPVLLHRQSGQSSRLDDAKHQTAIRIIDGGDVTTIQDDRGDVDYLRRKVQSGASVLRPPSGFASNTNRDARWGTDPTSQAPRTAQAPHYGISRHRVMN